MDGKEASDSREEQPGHDQGPADASTLPLESPAKYQIRLGPGWTLNDGTFAHQPLDKRRKVDVPYPSFVNHTFRSSNGLNSLQISRDAPITLCAMDVACDHIWKCLPQTVQTEVTFAPPNGPDLWGACTQTRDNMYTRMSDPVYLDEATRTTYRYYPDIKRKPWLVWPIWVEDAWGKDWVLISWYAESTGEKPDTYDRLIAYTVYDPRRSAEPRNDGKHDLLHDRQQRITGRLVDFLNRGGYDTSQAEWYLGMSCPMPLEDATSGERCFHAVKELGNVISNWVWAGKQRLSAKEGNARNPFPDLSRWVNPYQQRIEMAGINAWVLMASFDFNARIAVEAIQEKRFDVTANGVKRQLQPYDLCGPYHEPLFAPTDYLIPAKRSGGGKRRRQS
ncbi:hypothetical protein F5B20DRAFT_422888 [Whalleya microplaca]|nr:hypothetical protein F5B20DRAFT_422888 [Whalleya microplaca]